jgi:glycoprotein endo-alpha-1,2-mannosidase
LVDFFKTEGCSVLLGVPFYWRTLNKDTIRDKRLHDIIRKADIVHSWSVGRFKDSNGVKHVEKVWQEDSIWCLENKLTFMPVVFAGFSWGNLKGVPAASMWQCLMKWMKERRSSR